MRSSPAIDCLECHPHVLVKAMVVITDCWSLVLRLTPISLFTIGVYIIRIPKPMNFIFRLSNWKLGAFCVIVYFT